jgi:cytochrome c oxidase subunit 3
MNKNRKEIREKTSKPLLWIGMASIGMAFAGLTSGYVVSKSSLVSRGAWQTIALPNEFLLSTVFIILSSLLLVFASKKIRIGHYKYSTVLVGLALLFGTLFLLCQVLGWNNLIENQGVFFTGKESRPAGSWLYVITWFHWMHALAGVIVLLVAFIRSIRGYFTKENMLQFTLSSQFWHFLGFLWVYLLLFLTFLR